MPDKRSASTILVTGASGFIGHQFVRMAREEGHAILPLKRKSTKPRLAGDLLVFEGDIEALARDMDRAGCTCVVHCAASYSPADAATDTNSLVDANMTFGLSVLQAARLAGIENFINLGTLWEHDKDGNICPINLYAQLKLAFQDCLSYFSRAHNFQAITLKLADTYGELDRRGKLLTLLRNSARQGTPLQMTSGYQIINPVHVSDVCRAILLAVEQLSSSNSSGHQTYVVDGDAPCSVRDIVAQAQTIWDPPPRVLWGALEVDGRKPTEIWTDGPRLPGWKPRIDLTHGLSLMAP